MKMNFILRICLLQLVREALEALAKGIKFPHGLNCGRE